MLPDIALQRLRKAEEYSFFIKKQIKRDIFFLFSQKRLIFVRTNCFRNREVGIDWQIMKVIVVYLVVINVVTFFVYGFDKYRAQSHRRRISERTLLTLAVVGGSIGAWMAMRSFRHKTQHAKFKYGVPAILIAQIALLALASCSTPKNTIAPLPTSSTSDEAVLLPEHSPTTLIVTYDKEVGSKHLRDAIKKSGAEIIYDYSIIPGMAIRKPEDMTLDEAIAYFKKVKGVVAVERDYIHRLIEPIRPKPVER